MIELQQVLEYGHKQGLFEAEMAKKAWDAIKKNPHNRRADPWNHDLHFLTARFLEEIEEWKEAKTPDEASNELLDIANFCFYLWMHKKNGEP